MKRRIRRIWVRQLAVTTGLALALSGLTAWGGTPAYAATEYVVAPTGADTNAGTPAAPFRTIGRCAAVAVAGDTCTVRAGTYRETVRPANSGTASAPIVFRAAPGEAVTVDGTDPVSGWVQDAGNIYRAPVTLSGTAAEPYSAAQYPPNDLLWANQVFTGTTQVPEAAYPAPSADPFDQTWIRGGWSSARVGPAGTCDVPPCTATVNATMTYGAFPAFGDLTGVTAYFSGGWVAVSARVTNGNLDGTNRTLGIAFPQSDDKVYPGGGNVNQFRLVGSKKFLTGPNQWYYDPGARQLYMWAAGGAAPAGVVAKARNYSFDLNGRSDIQVRGFTTFANTVTTNDASIRITLDGLTATHLSQWQTAQYDPSLPYAGIYDANHRFDSGLLLHGTDHVLRNSSIRFSSGNGVNLMGRGHLVENNLIRDVGYNGTYTAAVTLEVGTSDSRILRNSMFNTGRDVINMNTNAYPNPGYKNIEIGWNDISGYAKISYDLGGIYFCCDTSLAGSRIHHNLIHDPANTGNGIHLDNGTYDVTIDHNLIYNLKGVGDVNRGGNGINFGGHSNRPPAGSNLPYLQGRIFNNTIVAGRNYTIFNYFARPGDVSRTEVRNNILDGLRPAGQDYAYIAGGAPQVQTNLVTSRSLDGSGPDPRYEDAGAGRFTPQAGSPAIDAGTVLAPITDGFAGARPDIGALETGATAWTAGCTLPGCPANPTSGGGAGGSTGPIVRPTGGLCVENRGAQAVANNPMVMATCTGQVQQQFTMAVDGRVQVQGGCLSVGAGSKVVWAACTGTAAQIWAAQSDTTLRNRASGQCLDLPAPRTAGTQLGVYRCIAGSLSQQWDAP